MTVEEIKDMVRSATGITEFQRRVYLALLDVPKGSLITYGELALKVGCKSPRAVGNALHKNPFAPLVPCHRVVRTNGEIGGYAFGSHEKIVVIPNPLALDWSILSEVNRIVLSFLYFKATDSIMQSGLCLSNPLGNNERLASSMWE